MINQFKLPAERKSDLAHAGGRGELACRIEHLEQDAMILKKARDELEARIEKLERRLANLEKHTP